MIQVRASGGGSGGSIVPIDQYYEYALPFAEDSTYIVEGIVGSGVIYSGNSIFTYPRKVILSCTGDLGAVLCDIEGTDSDGEVQNEQVTGPNNETVETIKWYSSLTSVSVSTSVSLLDIGIGDTLYMIDMSLAEHQIVTLVSDVTIEFTEASDIGILLLYLKNSRDHAIVWPEDMRWPRSILPRFDDAQNHWIHIMNTDGGTILDGAQWGSSNI